MAASKLNVLLIEDDEDDYSLVRSMLQSISSSAYDLEWVTAYEAAMAEMDQGGYDVCLLDYRLGADNGLDLLREATRRGFNKPVIFLTGQGDYTIDIEAMRAGAADYLVKGQITEPLLERSIRYAVGRNKAEDALHQHRLHLEELVAQRTSQLMDANTQLQCEIAERRSAEKEIRRAQEEWERTFNTVPDLIAVLDMNHRILRMNKAMADRLGMDARDGEGMRCHECIHKSPRPLEGCPHSLALRDGNEHTVELYEENLNGHFLVTVTPLRDSQGRMIGATHIARDISKRKEMENALRRAHDGLEVRVRERTAELAAANEQLRLEIEERKRAEAALRESERLLRSSIDALSVNLAILDEEGTIILINKAWKEFADANGFTGRNHGVGMNYLQVCDSARGHDSETAGATAEGIRRVLSRETDEFHMEYQGLSPEGTRWFGVRVTANTGDGRVRTVVAHEDITERMLIEEQIRHNAFHDPLTGLPNRALFLDRLELVTHRAQRRSNYKFAVLFVDLDKFKLINDSHGHTEGDRFLMHIAERIRQCTRSSDTVARLGGDEFAILLDDIKDASEAERFAERLQTCLSKAASLGGTEALTTASIGIVLNETGCGRPEDFLRDADIAMYRAKALGRGRHEFFDVDMRAQVVKRVQMETDLRKAFERREFRVFYQPIVCLETGRMDGLEALVRWMHPDRGLVSPADFIPVAEETGLIVPIGLWVLQRACGQMRHWHKWYPDSCPSVVSVNLSPKQLKQQDLVEDIERILKETELDSSCLELEITESAVMENAEDSIAVLSGLKEAGIKLSIDDFGTGYSSLSHLRRFPVDTLKIDRSFVSNMNVCHDNYEIVRTIVSLAHNLGLAVVAEGPEMAEHVEQLRGLGCEQAQGFYFAHPMEASGAEELLRGRHTFALRDKRECSSMTPTESRSANILQLPQVSYV